jgi:hypothetical protein
VIHGQQLIAIAVNAFANGFARGVKEVERLVCTLLPHLSE